MMIFRAGRAFYAATNIDGVGRNRGDRLDNVSCVQTAGQNEEARVADCGLRGRPIAGLTGSTPELGVVRIDQYIAIGERCCVFWFESRIG